MRLLGISAALFLLVASTASAATYKLDFQTDPVIGSPTTFYGVTLVFRANSIANLNFHIDKEGDPYDGPWDSIVTLAYETPDGVKSWKDPGYLHLQFMTDLLGSLIKAEFLGPFDIFDPFNDAEDQSYVYDFDRVSATEARYPGSWTLATVPLPATSLLALFSLGSLAFLRRMAAQKGRNAITGMRSLDA